MTMILESPALGSIRFDTEPGEFAGYVRLEPDGSTRLDWNLSVAAVPQYRAFPSDDPDDPDLHTFDPRAYHQSLRLPFRRLAAFDGRPIALDDPDTAWQDANGSFYLFSHETVLRATLRLAWRGGDRVHVAWEGFARTGFDEEDTAASTRFSIDAEATLHAVYVAGRDGEGFEAFRTRLAAHLDPDDFVAPAGVEARGSPDGGLDDDGSGRARASSSCPAPEPSRRSGRASGPSRDGAG